MSYIATADLKGKMNKKLQKHIFNIIIVIILPINVMPILCSGAKTMS